MIRICTFHGETIATSKNLRGVLRYASRHPVDVVTIEEIPGADYRVTFYFHGYPHASAEVTRYREVMSGENDG